MKIWDVCQQLSESATAFVTTTIVSVRGSSPQDPGAKMVVTKDGLHFGTVGGGKVELAAIKKSQTLLDHHTVQPPQCLTWNLQKDIGMSCGGEVTFLFEHFPATAWPIVIFGAGHIAQALTRVLKPLPCQLICVDSRKEWLDKLDGIKTLHHPHPKDLVATLNPHSFFICMTMGHAYDVPILLEIAKHAPQCPYVGVIGSEIKGHTIKNELKALDVPLSFIDKLKVPMGLQFGTNHPAEIAISIAAELLMFRDQNAHQM